MKVRFYFNDFTLYADIDWNFPVLPQKGEVVFLEGLVSLQKESSNVWYFDSKKLDPGEYILKKVYKVRETIAEQYFLLFKAKHVLITQNPIWRVISDTLTPCYITSIITDKSPLIEHIADRVYPDTPNSLP